MEKLSGGRHEKNEPEREDKVYYRQKWETLAHRQSLKKKKKKKTSNDVKRKKGEVVSSVTGSGARNSWISGSCVRAGRLASLGSPLWLEFGSAGEATPETFCLSVTKFLGAFFLPMAQVSHFVRAAIKAAASASTAVTAPTPTQPGTPPPPPESSMSLPPPPTHHTTPTSTRNASDCNNELSSNNISSSNRIPLKENQHWHWRQ